MDQGEAEVPVELRASPRPAEPVGVRDAAREERVEPVWKAAPSPAASVAASPAAAERVPATTLLESPPSPPVPRPPAGRGRELLELGAWPPFESWRAAQAGEVDPSSLRAFVGSGGRFPVMVMAADRAHLLRQSLAVLLSARGLTASDVVVVQDGQNEEVKRAALEYGVRVVQRLRSGGLRGGHMTDGSARIAEQYGAALALVMDKVAPEAPGVIVLEDDMLVSADFYEYFHATAALLEDDPTLWAVSAWNDNGFAHTLGRGEELALWRTRFFPGLGWLLSRRLWREELQKSWPREHWDHWMRHPDRHKGRDVLVPRISRDYHIGVRGTYMNREDHYRYFRSMAMQADGALRWFGNPAAADVLRAMRSDGFVRDLRAAIQGGCFLQSIEEVTAAAASVPVGVVDGARNQAVAYAASGPAPAAAGTAAGTGLGRPEGYAAAARIFPGAKGCPWVVFVHATAARDNADFRNIGGYFGLWHEPLRGSREGVRALRWGKDGAGVLLVVNAAGYARGGMDRKKDEMLPPFAVPPPQVHTLAASDFQQRRVPADKWLRPGLPPTDWLHRPRDVAAEDPVGSWRPGFVSMLPQTMPKTAGPPPTITGFGADAFHASPDDGPWVICPLDDPIVERDFTDPTAPKALYLWGDAEASALRRIPWAPFRSPAYPSASFRAPEASNDVAVLLEPSLVTARPVPAVAPSGAYCALRPRSSSSSQQTQQRAGGTKSGSTKSALDVDTEELPLSQQQPQQQQPPPPPPPPPSPEPVLGPGHGAWDAGLNDGTQIEGPHRLVSSGSSLRAIPPGVVVLASGRPGASCDDVCSEGNGAVGGGLVCVDESIATINKCPWLQAAFPTQCAINCGPSIGSDQPAFISERAPIDKAPGACFFSTERDFLRCDGHWEFAHRICPCARVER